MVAGNTYSKLNTSTSSAFPKKFSVPLAKESLPRHGIAGPSSNETILVVLIKSLGGSESASFFSLEFRWLKNDGYLMIISRVRHASLDFGWLKVFQWLHGKGAARRRHIGILLFLPHKFEWVVY